MAHHPVWLFACHHDLVKNEKVYRTDFWIEAVPDTPENERRLSRRQRDKTIQFIGAFGGGNEDLSPEYLGRAVTKHCAEMGVDISQPWRVIGGRV